jgi:hypothetical protein
MQVSKKKETGVFTRTTNDDFQPEKKTPRRKIRENNVGIS